MIVKVSGKPQMKRNRVYNFELGRSYEKKTRKSILKKVKTKKENIKWQYK